jgi:hypothetical protein
MALNSNDLVGSHAPFSSMPDYLQNLIQDTIAEMAYLYGGRIDRLREMPVS